MEAQIGMSEHHERPGFWIWVAVHAELIPAWSWPALVVIDLLIIYLGRGFQ